MCPACSIWSCASSAPPPSRCGPYPGGQTPSTAGLSELRISGSAEFSVPAWYELRGKLPDAPLTVVDLRQESHGFINDQIPISSFGKHDWANLGKSLQQVDADENARLARLQADGNATLYGKEGKGPPVQAKVSSVATEKQLVESDGAAYARIVVPDHRRPDDRAVDDFIGLFRALPPKGWLHLHCEGGVGRTTTFMAMTDILHNAKTVSLEDIIERQYLLGGTDLANLRPAGKWKQPYFEARLQFLRAFYEYARTNTDGYATTWSAWNAAHP